MNGHIKYAQPITNADIISQLPADQSQPSHVELRTVEALFKDHGNTMNSIAVESKDSLIVGILFIIFSLPTIDSFVIRMFPSAETSPYILLGIKTLALMLVYWVIKHFYLSKK